jgi:valyl-tRNA synthetase
MIKSRLYGDESEDVRHAVIDRAIDVFDASLRLLHPLMPFVTEELWQSIRRRSEGESIMRTPMLRADPVLIDRKVEEEMAFVQEVIESLRNIRGEMGIPPAKNITVLMKMSDSRTTESVGRYEGYMERLARVTSLSFIQPDERPKLAASAVVRGEEVFVPLEGLIDIEKEKNRLKKEIGRLEEMLAGIRNKLQNRSFVEKAPKGVVEKEREKLVHFGQTLEKLERNSQALS